jgi:hypothetical protein
MKKVVDTVVLNVPVSRTVVTEDSGSKSWRSVPDGHKQGTVELLIDIEALAAVLGRKALKNKSGKASMGVGLIQARVIPGSITRHAEKEVHQYEGKTGPARHFSGR